ncbi:MAG: cytochrome P450 [Anaerolineae bacterium]|nr:cytochrome P450 [Anaerolineae bacterium]
MTTTSTASVRLHEPPSVPGLPLLGNMIPFIRTQGLPIDFMREAAAQYGDLVRLKVGGDTFYLIAHPDLVHDVLVKRINDFDKVSGAAEKPVALARFLGNSILTANYEDWRPQRKLIQPLMHTTHIRSYANTMAQFADKMTSQWQDGAVRDMHVDMMQVTIWIIAETMFGTDVTHTPELQEVAQAAQAIAVSDLTSPLPAALTHGRDRKAEQVNAVLTNIVQRFMAERGAQGNTDRHDLLALLMETRDEDGQPMSDEFVRNNILTLFFAGHETTANTLTWALYYLDKNPAVAAELHKEVDAVLGGRLPTLDDLPHLPYTAMVINETMRNEPTVAVIPRFVMNDTELGGYHLKGGSVAFVSPYILHHDPRWWTHPDQFDPTRFSAENEPNIPKYAYLPFGGGPRVCIGNHFALMEAQILLATFASRYQFSLMPGTAVEPIRQVTTSPKHGLPMRLTRRV